MFFSIEFGDLKHAENRKVLSFMVENKINKNHKKGMVSTGCS